jgi:MFS family permease
MGTPARIGPIVLAPGVKRSFVWFNFLVVCSTISMSVFMASIQPYVFTEQLHIPREDQGALAGNLAGIQQIAPMIFLLFFGTLGDRIGRMPLLIPAVLGLTAVTFLYPFATTVPELYLARFLFGLAFTANTAGGASLLIDLPDNGSRGRLVSLQLLIQSAFIAVIVSFLGTRLPGWLTDAGISVTGAGAYTFWMMGCVGLIGCLAVTLGMKKENGPRQAAPAKAPVREQLAIVFKNLGRVIRHARENRRFRVVMIAACIVRSDLAVVTSFLSLWIVTAGHDQGVSTTDALRRFGSAQGILYILGIVIPVICGFLVDRYNRLTLLMVSLGLVTIAFSSTALVKDIMGPRLIAVIVLIAIAEGLQNLAAQSLVGQEAPADLRGSCYSMFAWLGTVSVVIITFISGQLFDSAGYTAPFLMIAAISTVTLIIALLTLRADRKTAAMASL